ATQQQLARGARTVEILKQPQYEPVPVERQVVVIYAVTNGHLDDVEIGDIRKWEKDFLAYLDASHPEVLTGIRTKKDLTEEITSELKAAIKAFKPLFVPTHG
ncbi:MAG TPA: F0F1 ATP synthase subunit alpha, partial [Gemmatimonadales bacterium]|nr:F0F1 ATP synthase subunit alpha [Gemmatimonadales bacterium]